MHEVLDTRATEERCAPDELTPDQWLNEFYENRKGSGKTKAAPARRSPSTAQQAGA